MDIPISTKVKCQNEECGKIICVIINPISKMITHIVVREKGFLGIERLIPVEEILESRRDEVTLPCSPDQLSRFQFFTETTYIGEHAWLLDDRADHDHYFPFTTPGLGAAFGYERGFEEIECIPEGELGIHSSLHDRRACLLMYERTGNFMPVDSSRRGKADLSQPSLLTLLRPSFRRFF